MTDIETGEEEQVVTFHRAPASQWGVVQISGGRVWHDILTPTRMFDTYRTLCERTIVARRAGETGGAGTLADEIPEGGRRCKSCAKKPHPG